ncbi:MAG TPA: biotin--[acetyl-CoA-carboxylase] ligase [Xanthobacteraceae bacterium]|jgi:BirA family biotin operon repressor/biotin-[acetyl-CoA-carboxylase] ligase|nr:biotin--[acetyl-CoA-carboxylase] ligase [Xanthobacteraceae bacterium]
MQLDPIAVAAGVRVEVLGTTGSTNTQARLRASAGATGPLWITAITQTEGRGRHGRSWISPPGNLHASLLLRDPAPFEQAPQLAFVAALALRDAVALEAASLVPQLAFKWPNDLLLDGRKCAGILIEGEAASDGAAAEKHFIVIVGIGVNCVNHPPPDDSNGFLATNLQAHGAAITPKQLFQRLSATMCARLAQWDRGRGLPAILGDWLAHARGIGEQIRVRNGAAEVQGRFVGLDQSGRLVLELKDGSIKTISAGDVFDFTVAGHPRIPDRPG